MTRLSTDIGRNGHVGSPVDSSLVGRRLGRGCRFVYEYGVAAVIKFGCPLDSLTGGQNLAEAARWQSVKDTPLARFFVPVLDYAADGSWLIMDRAQPLMPHEYPRLRAFVEMVAEYGIREEDPQTDNTGTYQGRTAFLDYGFDKAYRDGLRLGYKRCRQCQRCQEAGE